jgi:hypothetical protein
MLLDREYTIFCDESEKHGRYYSNFYGGLIVSHRDYEAVTARLEAKKRELNFYGEVKWAKVSASPYLEKYQALITTFFDEVRAGNVRVRIMFRQNARQATGLSTQQVDDAYFLLYYQFLKHAFGLLHLPPKESEERPTRLRLYFDKFPETHEKIQNFRGYLLGLPANATLREAKIIIQPEDITEVDSHGHVLLQCLDIVMGAMAFRLNEKHKEKLPDTQRRGRKTRAKEKLYKTIHAEICTLRPRFNIGVSTGGTNAELLRHWSDPYRHWNFEPKNAVVDSELFKPKRKKPPG